jgi:hypothetical protein
MNGLEPSSSSASGEIQWLIVRCSARQRRLIARTAACNRVGLLRDLSDSEASRGVDLAGDEALAFFTALQIVFREKGFSRKSDI